MTTGVQARLVLMLRRLEFSGAYGTPKKKGFQRRCEICDHEIPEDDAEAAVVTHASRHKPGCELAALLDDVRGEK